MEVKRCGTLLVVFALSGGVATPVAAQPAIGVILGNDDAFSRAVSEAFAAELKRSKVEAQLLTQRPNRDTLAWANTARKFSAFDVEMLLVVGTPVGLSALSGEIDVPVIFAAPAHEAPRKASGTITGVTWRVPLAGVMKYLESIRDFAKLGIVSASGGSQTKSTKAELDRLAATFGYSTDALKISSSTDAKSLGGAEALFITEDCVRSSCLTYIVAAAREAGLPTASITPGAEDAGVLLTLEVDPLALGAAAARLAVQVLKGKAPASIPVAGTKKIAMVINLKEAGAMGVKVPFDVLSAASRVIK